MILGGDLDLAGGLVTDRMVGAAVAELELEGLATEGLAQDLVPKADAEDGDPARLGGRANQGPQRLGCFPDAPGSPGPFDRKIPSG